MKKKLYIIDIKRKVKFSKQFSIIFKQINNDDKILSLTPFSHFLLEQHKIPFQHFHDLISIIDFREKVLQEYALLEEALKEFTHLFYLLRMLMQSLTYRIYVNIINEFINSNKLDYNIVYITDMRKDEITFENVISNTISLLYYNKNIDEFIHIKSIDSAFYKKHVWKRKIETLISYRHNMTILISKFFKKKSINGYDGQYFSPFFYNTTHMSLDHTKVLAAINNEIDKCKALLLQNEGMEILYADIFDRFKEDVFNIKDIKYKSFSYLSSNKMFMEATILKENDVPTIFFQHGNYLYPHMFLKYCEIQPASVNLVFNDYTKILFEKNGANKVFSVGSIAFNKVLRDKKTKYDYVYITYSANYAGNISYIESKDCLYSLDGYEIYQRHKEIIDYFGEKCKNKRICIKMHPGIISYGLYVPVLELSKKYKNITIEFATPIFNLIEKSKYIISDYFSSEFINRELHYKRDIILFKDGPIPLPVKVLDDMNKMFILVEKSDELFNVIENIDSICKNRKRYDDIIEYYSSKKCDTKKAVIEILEKELDGR